MKKEVSPKWCLVNTNWYTNILSKNHFTNRVTKNLFMRKDVALTRVCLAKYLLSVSLEDQQIDVLEKPMHFLTLDLKKKLITSEGTLCRMVVYKVLQWKVEIDFFLTLILFSMVAIGKEFCTTQNFLQPE